MTDKQPDSNNLNRGRWPKGRSGNPRGRPRRSIDLGLVEELARVQCNHGEIAVVLGVTGATLERSQGFLRAYNKGSEEGKQGLRRRQWEKAYGREGELFRDEDGAVLRDERGRAMYRIPPLAPDTTMLIWLGKQVLGQVDRQEHTGKKGQPIVHHHTVRYQRVERGD
ncbi:MAG: DUF5681 domain-containing protein [Dehalococcoidia bacterium]